MKNMEKRRGCFKNCLADVRDCKKIEKWDENEKMGGGLYMQP